MNDEKFLIEYEKLLNKDYCNCNEMNCIDNNSPRRILNIAKRLQHENQKLKKQLEEYKKWYQDMLEENSKLSQLWCDSRAKIAELEKQQKEFIEWLKKMINNLDNDINKINGLSENSKCEKERFTIKYNFLIQINEKYKEIIGVKDDRN